MECENTNHYTTYACVTFPSLFSLLFPLLLFSHYFSPPLLSLFSSPSLPPSLPPSPRYDAHINLLGYPFLDSKEEFSHSTEACDVMHPQKNDPPLSIIDLSTVTIGSLQQLLQETDYFGFPCVVTASSQLLDGFVTRKDIQYVIGEQGCMCKCVSGC